MKVLVTADIHLGFRSLPVVREGFNVRELDVYHSFLRVLQVAQEEKPDLVVIAGDLFDQRRPPIDAINVAFEVLGKLPDTIVVGGNHDNDGPRERSPLRILRRLSHVEVVLGDPRILEVKGSRFFCVPFTEVLPKFLPADYLVGHLRDNRVPEFRASSIRVPNERYSACFLGDLHRYFLFENLVYPGATERLSFQQEQHSVGVCLYESGRFSRLEFPGRKFVTLEGPPEDEKSLEGAVVRCILEGGGEGIPLWVEQLKAVALHISVSWVRKEDDHALVPPSRGNLLERFDKFVSQKRFSREAVELARSALQHAVTES